MDNKEEILLKMIDVLYSIEEDFCINTRQHGERDSFPTWYANLKLDDDNKSRWYSVYLCLNTDDKFEITVCRKDRYFDLFRSYDNMYNFETKIVKTDELHRRANANSNAYEIIFDYSNNEFKDLQRKIFDYFEVKNEFDLNYVEILKARKLKEKAEECADILHKSVGKKIKRENGLNNILNDE